MKLNLELVQNFCVAAVTRMTSSRIVNVYMKGIIIVVVTITLIDEMAILRQHHKSEKKKFDLLTESSLSARYDTDLDHSGENPKRNLSVQNEKREDDDWSSMNEVKSTSQSSKIIPQELKEADKAIETNKELMRKSASEKLTGLTTDENQEKVIALFRLHHPLLRQRIKRVKMSSCLAYTNCKIIDVELLKNRIIDADAVIFEGRKLPGLLPRHVSENQVFVFMDLEPPLFNHKTDLDKSRFYNFFNYTMTYRSDSSIPLPYGSIASRSATFHNIFKSFEYGEQFGHDNMDSQIFSDFTDSLNDLKRNYSQIFQQKKKSVVWLVSHCNTTSRREKYVEEMQKYINVDIIGECNKSNQDICPKVDKAVCEAILAKDYKFYIAFENSICEHYITEKVYHWFGRDIVTIVRGARRYENFLPKGTFIDTDHFESPKDLALFLRKLGANEKEYTDILRRKDNYKVVSVGIRAQMAFCNLCYRINNIGRNKNVISNIYKWWNEKVCLNIDSLQS